MYFVTVSYPYESGEKERVERQDEHPVSTGKYPSHEHAGSWVSSGQSCPASMYEEHIARGGYAKWSLLMRSSGQVVCRTRSRRSVGPAVFTLVHSSQANTPINIWPILHLD